MALQRWPGSGTAVLGYGVPGNVTLDKNLNVITPRQQRIGGFINGGTSLLVEPVHTSGIGDHISSRAETLQAFLGSIDLGGVDLSLLKTNAFESQVLSSPGVIDPQVGRRIGVANNTEILFADDTFVQFFNIEQEKLQTRIDMKSPVVQVDRNGVIRTRKGLALTTNEGIAEYFAEGDFVHVSSIPSHMGTDVMATSATGTVMLFDVATKQCKWKERKQRSSISGWSRVVSGVADSPEVSLWCNQYTMGYIDTRQPPTSTTTIVLEFNDHQQEIRDLDNGFEGGDAFSLTSYDIRWMSQNSPMLPLLTLSQPIAIDDYTTCLYKGQHSHNNLVTVTSQLMPLTLAAVFGEIKKLPCLLDDPYLMESWPTIIPQSHITVENAAGTAVWSVGAEGGLYKQQWNEAEQGEVVDDLIDLPVTGNRDLLTSQKRTKKPEIPEARPYELLKNNTPSFIYNFSKVYNMAFAPLGPEFDSETITDDDELNMSHVDARSVNDFRAQCRQVWVDPLISKSRTTTVPKEVIEQRERCVNKIVQDMVEIRQNHVYCLSDLDLTPDEIADKEIEEILSGWPLSNEEHFESSQGVSQGYLSQPTQVQHFDDLISSQTDEMPLSQPMPTLGGSKRKHKHKRKHKKKKLISSQP